MPASKAASTKPGSQCHLVEPHLKLPSSAMLERFDDADRELLVKYLSGQEQIEYVAHELFGKRSAEKTLFGGRAELREHATHFVEKDAVDPTAGTSGASSTLTSAMEILLFQRFNFARLKIARILQKHDGKSLPYDSLRLLLGWIHRAMTARSQITKANMPLVLAMAKRTRLGGLDFNDLISEGNFALLRSVDKFDCSRGFKFSTYACRAILKAFSRVALKTSRYRGRFPIEFDPMLERSDYLEHKRDDAKDDCVGEIRDILTHNRASLNEMEQVVIRERFALNAPPDNPKPKTLEQVGEIIGVTKERVRQIQNKALRKIRIILEESYLAA